MIHLESFIEAQRIMCLKKYNENYSSTWKYILAFNLKKVGGKYLLQCNYEISKLPKEVPLFYKQCQQAWNLLKLPCDVDSKIEKHILRNIELILIENKTVYNQRLVNKGIRRINDLLSTNGSFFTMEDLLSKGLNMNDIFLVIGIIDALPDHWREKLRMTTHTKSITLNNDDIYFSINGKLTKLENLKQKTVYYELISKISSQPTAQKCFSKKYPLHTFEWDSIYPLPRKVTIECRTRDFQYKILNRILFTNKMLFKMKISDTDKCTFCNEEEETIEHLLTTCKYTLPFWKEVIKWLKTYNIHENLDELKILFGVLNNNCLDLVNHIILIGKQVIYLCRSKKIKPAFDIFLNWIKRVAEIEHDIAQRREALDKDYNKWNHLLKWLQSSNTL